MGKCPTIIDTEGGYLDNYDEMEWSLSKRTTPGDLLLMYRCYPLCCITDVFIYSGKVLKRGEAGWRDGESYFGQIQRICGLDSPLFLKDLRRDKILKTASFIRRNLQGVGLLASEYWPYLYTMICERNPNARKMLADYAPERL